MQLKKNVIDSSGNIVCLSIAGKIKSGYLAELENEFKKLSSGKVKLILDLQDVGAIDSSGVGELVKARSEISRSGGNVVLLVSGRVQTIIKLSGLENYFQIATTHEQAVELLHQPPVQDDSSGQT